MRFDVVTLFPDMFTALNVGITGRAQKHQLISLHYWNPRNFTEDKQGRIDDRPYGGGPGMVMQVQPLRTAIQAAHKATPTAAKAIYLSPQGRLLTQKDVQQFTKNERLILVAGRYEGIDERVIAHDIDEEWSIGDYVLSGGELAAMVLIDAIVRLLPEALGDPTSIIAESFNDHLLDFPHYTRPEEIQGERVPAELLSGNHQAIQRWRLQQALGKTWLHRPDLLATRGLNAEEAVLLQQFIEQRSKQ